MIQRIQSVYLFFVLAISLSMFFLPFCQYQNPQQQYILHLSGITNITNPTQSFIIPGFSLQIINIIIGLLSVIAIFAFNSRSRQIKLVKTTMLLLVLFAALLFFYSNILVQKMQQPIDKTYLLSIYLPLVSFIFSYLALISIKKDEELVRSADRIR